MELVNKKKTKSSINSSNVFVSADVYVVYCAAVVDLNGRYFGGRIVKGNFYSLDKFHQFELAEPVE